MCKVLFLKLCFEYSFFLNTLGEVHRTICLSTVIFAQLQEHITKKRNNYCFFFCGILVKIFRLVRISLWFFLTDLLGSLCGKRWTKLLLWVSKNFIANKVAVLSTLLLQKYIYHSLRTFSVNPSEVKSFAIAKNLHKVKPSFMRHSLYPLF